MKRYKNLLATVVAMLLTVVVSAPASAQWATFDASNFIQNLQQVEQLKVQLQNMQNQLNQVTQAAQNTKQTFQALHGSSGMGTLLQSSVGQFGTSSMQDTTSAAGIQALASAIKQKAGFLSTQNLSGINEAYRAKLLQFGDDAAAQQATQQQVFDQSGQEFKNIAALMDQINTAQDPKTIQGLQARIQVEQAMLQNQVIRATAMQAALQAQDRVQLQQQTQEAAAESFNYYNGN